MTGLSTQQVVKRGEKHGCTRKQSLLVREYLSNGGNKAKAARDAGYSARSAGPIADETLRKPNVRNLTEELAEWADAGKGVTKDQIRTMILKEAMTAGSDGARVSAQKLLAQTEGMLIERRENVDKTPDSLEADLRQVLPAEAVDTIMQAMGQPSREASAGQVKGKEEPSEEG